jgi:TonB family protein
MTLFVTRKPLIYNVLPATSLVSGLPFSQRGRQLLRPAASMNTGRHIVASVAFLAATLIAGTVIAGPLSASTLRSPVRHAAAPDYALDLREQQMRTATVRRSELADLTRTNPACEITQPPQALTTPDPLLGATDAGTKVTVSFIVSTDGTVQSPFILESTGSYEDRSVLEAVRAWRYRPATCNGVPMEAEGRIEFSSR